jgi:hypothetical protein
MLPRLIIVKISVLHPSDYRSTVATNLMTPFFWVTTTHVCYAMMSTRSIWLGNLWKTKIVMFQVTHSSTIY